jgi:integrase
MMVEETTTKNGAEGMVDVLKVRIVKRQSRKYWEAEFIDPRTGHRKRVSLKTVNKREAEREAGRIEEAVREGQWKATRKMKWKDFKRKYETEGMFDLASATVSAFQEAAKKLEKLVRPSTLQSLTEEKLNSFTTHCLMEGLSKHTVARHLRHLKAALRWAVSQKLLLECPAFRMPKGTSSGKAKGRAITGEEFERMLEAVPKVVETDQTDSWTFLLKGLWWSGLRLGEALKLSWDNPKDLMVDLSGKRPFMRIQGTAEKGKKDRILPLAPEAAELLQTVPENERDGLVFKLKWQRAARKPARVDTVSPIITQIGKKAGVRVSDTKTASAHDLRRSFGLRWADRVKPHILQQLMRHASVQTTLTFYVQSDADDMAEAVWSAFEQKRDSTAISVPLAENAKKESLEAEV